MYYITDRRRFSGDEPARQSALLDSIRRASAAGVDFIQLREKDLSPRELLHLAERARKAVPGGSRTRLLINSRIDIAIACGADGVHLRADDISASDARVLFHCAGITQPVIAVSCHSLQEVQLAESHGADFAVFGPVFGKGDSSGIGLDALSAICHRTSAANPRMPVLALGGVNAVNASHCVRAGAAGIAAIWLFQQSQLSGLVTGLRQRASNL